MLTDAAESMGATPNDEAGIVRHLVSQHNLGFNAWFCVCCELANRQARARGFEGAVDEAFTLASAKMKAVALLADIRGNTFRNANWTKRDYECTNVVACKAATAPSVNWEPCSGTVLDGLTKLHSEAGVEYWGYL